MSLGLHIVTLLRFYENSDAEFKRVILSFRVVHGITVFFFDCESLREISVVQV